MQKRRQVWICVLIVVSVFFAPSFLRAQDTVADVCMHSFERYAHSGPRDPDEALQLPVYPWEPVVEVSNHLPENYYLSHIELARYHDADTEIWISAVSVENTNWPIDAPYAPNVIKESQRIWVVYSTQTHQVKIISTEIQESPLIVYQLFVDNNGAVWGSIVPKDTSEAGSFPVLSVFNGDRQRFELAEEIVEIPINSYPMIAPSPDNNLLWILVNNDALYAFDPETQTVSQKVDLSGIEPDYITTSPDGTLYFSTSLGNPTAPGYASLEQVSLYQFFPETNELIQVILPHEWPVYRGLLADRAGRLWLGSIGFRDTDDVWHLMYPNSEQFFEYPLTISRTFPTLLFESSDGKLWYTNWWDGGIWYNGTAWYDPQTGEGCMFTNTTSSLLEDTEQQLWLVANGNLYKQKLIP